MPIHGESRQAQLAVNAAPAPRAYSLEPGGREAKESVGQARAAAQVVFKTTDQLLDREREQMRALFLRVFNKHMIPEAFDRKFFYTPKGYSYHGLMLHEEVVVGAMSAVPVRYKFFDEEHTFALSVDVMIAPEHRGGGHVLTMANLLHQGLIRDRVPFIFGFPNERFYPIQKRSLQYEDIGELDYYIVPLNIGAVDRKLRLFNGLSRSFCRWAIRFSRIPCDPQVQCNIAKVTDAQFEQHRYDESYSKLMLGEGAVCRYKIHEEEGGIRTLHIIDVIPLTPALLAKALKQVFEAASSVADIIIYVGRLPATPPGFWKVPDSKKPRRVRMTGRILIPGLVNCSVFELGNWRVNLSDFDVR